MKLSAEKKTFFSPEKNLTKILRSQTTDLKFSIKIFKKRNDLFKRFNFKKNVPISINPHVAPCLPDHQVFRNQTQIAEKNAWAQIRPACPPAGQKARTCGKCN